MPEPVLPFCRNGCLKRMRLVAQEVRPVEMLCGWCEHCKEMIINTKIPGREQWAETTFRNVTAQSDVIWAIEQESFRLGLPKPSIKAA